MSHFIILNNKEADCKTLEIIERLLMKTGFALNEDVSAVKLASLWKELAGGLAGVQAEL